VTEEDAAAFARCLAGQGVAVFPADTVYGLACEPDSQEAVHRLYRLKGRTPGKPSAVMFFDLDLALVALPELPAATGAALHRLLPGAVTVLLPNPGGRFPLASPGDPESLGVRVPRLEGPVAPLAAVRLPVLQSSANLAGGRDPRRLDEVPDAVRQSADLVLDGGELPGTPSTVVDLRGYADSGEWSIVREGAVPREALEEALSSEGR
jgi:L-threonylcarbamoyladenylate synthase